MPAYRRSCSSGQLDSPQPSSNSNSPRRVEIRVDGGPYPVLMVFGCIRQATRGYASNAYSVATPRGRLDVAFRTRPTSSPFPIDAVPCFRPLSREARRTPWAKLRVQRVRFHDAVRRPRLRRLEKANPRSQWGADQAMKRQAPVLALLNFGTHQHSRTAPKKKIRGSFFGP